MLQSVLDSCNHLPLPPISFSSGHHTDAAGPGHPITNALPALVMGLFDYNILFRMYYLLIVILIAQDDRVVPEEGIILTVQGTYDLR